MVDGNRVKIRAWPVSHTAHRVCCSAVSPAVQALRSQMLEG
jgi:hypothetical protein